MAYDISDDHTNIQWDVLSDLGDMHALIQASAEFYEADDDQCLVVSNND